MENDYWRIRSVGEAIDEGYAFLRLVAERSWASPSPFCFGGVRLLGTRSWATSRFAVRKREHRTKNRRQFSNDRAGIFQAKMTNKSIVHGRADYREFGRVGRRDDRCLSLTHLSPASTASLP